jgi:tRNA A-37 threonylcarbamoyl transferase component Bud32
MVTGAPNPDSTITAPLRVSGRGRTTWTNRSADLGEDPTSAIDELMDGADADCEHTFKDDTRSLVQLRVLGDRRWVVKRYRAPALKTFVYHLVRQTPAWREWRHARTLRRLGVRVLEPTALVHERGGCQWSQALITPHVPAPTLKQWVHDQRNSSESSAAMREQRRRVAQSVGHQIGTISASGLSNRDHKATNLLIDERCAAGQQPPLLIDPAGLRRRQSDQAIYRMLALLAQTAERGGPITLREKLTCLRRVLKRDSSLARDERRRLRHTVSCVNDLLLIGQAAGPGRGQPVQ